MKKNYILIIIIIFIKITIQAQITLKIDSKVNTICTGSGCEYEEPKILINEVMLAPKKGEGSIYGTGNGFPLDSNKGEWIELYNPDKCKSIDISCYFLGNNAADYSSSGMNDYGAGLTLPQGTVVPPRGFVVIRGIWAPAVSTNLLIANGGNTIEIVVDDAYATEHVCLGGGFRFWFPNAGGWIAVYDNKGVPKDAISWNSISNFCNTCEPCNPVNCFYPGTYSSYSNIPTLKKNYITSVNPQTYAGSSFQRNPDGGFWQSTPKASTYGTCNATCIPTPEINCTGEATVTPSGGTGSYNYRWDDAKVTKTATVTGLCAGIYHVTVTDANNNSAVKDVEIKNIEIDANVSATNVKCFSDKNGIITANASNGTSPYTYAWSNGSNSNIVSNLGAGNYSVIITDKNGCIKTLTTTVSQPDEIKLTAKIDSVKCNGQKSGNISVETTGGMTPYSYLWNTSPAQTEADAVDLGAGTYTVTVTDKNGCVKSLTKEIFQPSAITLNLQSTDVRCENSCNGMVSITANGGIKPYNYHWSNDKLSPSISDLCAGTYTITLTDQNGCTKISSSNVGTEISINADFKVSPTSGIADSTFFKFKFTGTDAVSYFWDFGDYYTSSEQNPTHLYSYPGTYKVFLVVSNGPPFNCQDTFSKKINVNTLFIFDAGTDKGIICGEIVQLNCKVKYNGYGTLNYNWAPAYGLSDTTISKPFANPINTTRYYITVSSTDGYFGVDSVNVKVYPADFYIDFNANETKLTYPDFYAQFTNNTPNIDDYNFYWDFGDGSPLLLKNTETVNHQYTCNWIYTVKLIAIDKQTGCSDTLSRNEYIWCVLGPDCDSTIIGLGNTKNINKFINNIYPNPFRQSAVISYELPKRENVNISIFNVLGNKVSTLVNDEKSEGKHEVMFDAKGLPEGIYFYKIVAGDREGDGKIVIMK